MSQNRDKNLRANMQSDSLDDTNPSSFTRSLNNNAQYSPLVDPSLPYPGAKGDTLGASHGLDSNEDSEMEADLGESLAGLEINGFSNSRVADSIFDGTNDLGMDTSWSQRTSTPVESLVYAYNRIHGTHNIHTPSQTSNVAASCTPWQHLSHRPIECSTNLYAPTYAPKSSSAATHSQNSDSAWETIPTTPSVDDADMRPIPDGNSASIQSYNDPRTGIWFGITYRRDPTYNNMGPMPSHSGTSPTATKSQILEQVFAAADAATPFGSESCSNAGAPLVTTALDVDERPEVAHPFLSTPSMIRRPAPQVFQSLFGGQSCVSLPIDGPMNVGASSAQQPPEVEHLYFHSSSGHESLQNIVPEFEFDKLPLPATSSLRTTSMEPSISASTPSAPANTSLTGVAKCTHKGCQAAYTGSSRKDSLRRHRRNGHGNKPELICPECNLVFHSGRPDNLKRHFAVKHPDCSLPASFKVRTKKSASRRQPSNSMS